MNLDTADLALIEIDENVSPRELALVAEVCRLRSQIEDVRRRIQKAAYTVVVPDGLDALYYVQEGVER